MRDHMTVEEIMTACTIRPERRITPDIYCVLKMYKLRDDINALTPDDELPENFRNAKRAMKAINRMSRDRAQRRGYHQWLERYEGSFEDYVRWQNQREREISGINDSIKTLQGLLSTSRHLLVNEKE